MTIVIEQCEKLAHNKSAYVLAMRMSADMIEKGFFLWGPSWNAKTIAAIKPNGTCAGLLQYSRDPDVDYMEIDLTCVDPDHRGGGGVLIMLLAKLREICTADKIEKIRFTYHPDNAHMKDAARIMGGRIRNVTAEVNLKNLPDV